MEMASSIGAGLSTSIGRLFIFNESFSGSKYSFLFSVDCSKRMLVLSSFISLFRLFVTVFSLENCSFFKIVS